MSIHRVIATTCVALAAFGLSFVAAAGPIQEKGVGDVLLMVTQIAGIGLLIATMILLFFRRVVLDAEIKHVTSFKFPILGELSTQSPVLVLVAIAALMVLYPLSQMRASVVSLEGDVDTGGEPVSVVIVAVPDYQQIRHTPGRLNTSIPLLNTNATYRVLFIVDKQIIKEIDASLEGGHIKLGNVKWDPPLKVSAESELKPRKDITDAEVAKSLR